LDRVVVAHRRRRLRRALVVFSKKPVLLSAHAWWWQSLVAGCRRVNRAAVNTSAANMQGWIDRSRFRSLQMFVQHQQSEAAS
jgi:hypothetical protein